jgi:hypothetical protein
MCGAWDGLVRTVGAVVWMLNAPKGPGGKAWSSRNGSFHNNNEISPSRGQNNPKSSYIYELASSSRN